MAHLPKRKSCLSNDNHGFIFHKERDLYAPKDLMDIDKGVTIMMQFDRMTLEAREFGFVYDT